MEGCDTAAINLIRSLSRNEIVDYLESESSQKEITKSILNLLHNIVVRRSIQLTPKQKAAFVPYSDVVRELVAPSTSIEAKRQLLLACPGLVRAIALACPSAK